MLIQDQLLGKKHTQHSILFNGFSGDSEEGFSTLEREQPVKPGPQSADTPLLGTGEVRMADAAQKFQSFTTQLQRK